MINKDILYALNELPDKYFDCIILNDILEHLSDPHSLLKNINQKLSINGVIVASIPNIRYFEVLFFLLLFKRWDYKDHGVLDKTHSRFFTQKNIKELFQESGYEVVTLKGIHPTSSILYNFVNCLTLGFMWDSRYMQFACVSKKMLTDSIKD